MYKVFTWLDDHGHTPAGKLLNQFMPVTVCLILLATFMALSHAFIVLGINPLSTEKVVIQLLWPDVIAGFMLYFFTAIDYALVVGRMQTVNSGAQARFLMNVFTCVGCFVGVTIVLFLWGFAKEVVWLIIPILIFAGAVMIKLGYEGRDYFEHSKQIPHWIRRSFITFMRWLFIPAHTLTHWMPQINTPKIKRMSSQELIKWSFLLPFIIGTDDLVGYMGAMTIYNVFSLLLGIYVADILIDILIFVSPTFTKKLVENPYLSLAGTLAFLYLAYKSFSEAMLLGVHNWAHQSNMILVGCGVLAVLALISLWQQRKRGFTEIE